MKAKLPTAQNKRSNLLHLPYYFVFIFHSLIVCFLAWMVYSAYVKRTAQMKPELVQQTETLDKMKITRNGDYKFVKPLRLTDLYVESEQLKSVKHDILMYLENQKKGGQIGDASVYLRRLNDGSWISINDQQTYKPGSIAKVPLMIYFLKMAEMKPGYLKREFSYDRPIASKKHETYKGNSLTLGKKYTIDELLTRMIVYSDNIATTMLLLHMDQPEIYKKIYRDLDIPLPEPYDQAYSITASDISKFMRVLYSSTYLSESSSEYAMELLTRSEFNEGLASKLPKDVKIAHKFGEAGEGDRPEFSETGVVYSGNNTYLITVMTRGTEVKQQAETISEISKLVYDKMKE